MQIKHKPGPVQKMTGACKWPIGLALSVLLFSTAFTCLDPSLSSGGTTPDRQDESRPARLLQTMAAVNDHGLELFTGLAEFEAAHDFAGAETAAFTIEESSSLSEVWAWDDHGCASNIEGIDLFTAAAEDELSVNISAPQASRYICIIGPGWNAPASNISPRPVSPTVIANGEDDFRLAFSESVQSSALELLTNRDGVHVLTVEFEDGSRVLIDDSLLDTRPASFEFIGLRSQMPITAIELDGTGGRTQNEGITAVYAGRPESDRDGDGIADSSDACPDSNTTEVLTFAGCEMNVSNGMLDGGCWAADLLQSCKETAGNHGQMVSCSAAVFRQMAHNNMIEERQHGQLQRCIARQNNGHKGESCAD